MPSWRVERAQRAATAIGVNHSDLSPRFRDAKCHFLHWRLARSVRWQQRPFAKRGSLPIMWFALNRRHPVNAVSDEVNDGLPRPRCLSGVIAHAWDGAFGGRILRF